MDDADVADGRMRVERLEPTTEAERVYLDELFAAFEHVVEDPQWQRWWHRSHEGDLLLRATVGDDRSYPRVERVPGGVVATVCRREIDFADDETARTVARTNAWHLFLTMQGLLDLKQPPELEAADD